MTARGIPEAGPSILFVNPVRTGEARYREFKSRHFERALPLRRGESGTLSQQPGRRRRYSAGGTLFTLHSLS